MNTQFQDEVEEAEPYLEKPSGRMDRLNKTAKATKHSTNRKKLEQRKYEDGFGGNFN